MRIHGAPGRALLLLVLALASFAAGCSRKLTQPDSSYTTPEGVRNSSMLMVGWKETIQTSYLAEVSSDNWAAGTLLGTTSYFRTDPEGIRVQVMDASPANGLGVLRANAAGALQPLTDYPLRPVRKDLNSHIAYYDFEDVTRPAGGAYVGRGLFDGVATAQSPLTNTTVPFGDVDETVGFALDHVQADSTMRLRVTPTPGAVFYVFEIARADAYVSSVEAALKSAFPSAVLPFPNAKSFITLLTPAQIESSPLELPFFGFRFPLSMLIRVSAYNAEGRMISRLNDYVGIKAGTTWTFVPSGGTVVSLNPYRVADFVPPTTWSRAEMANHLLEWTGGAPAPAPSLNRWVDDGQAPAGDATAASAAVLAPASPSAIARIRSLLATDAKN